MFFHRDVSIPIAFAQLVRAGRRVQLEGGFYQTETSIDRSTPQQTRYMAKSSLKALELACDHVYSFFFLAILPLIPLRRYGQVRSPRGLHALH